MSTGGRLSPGGFTNLQLRVMSAVVLIAVTLAVAWRGGGSFRVFAAAIGAAMLYEWIRMARAPGDGTQVATASLASTALLVALVAGAGQLPLLGGLVALVVLVWAAGLPSGRGYWLPLGVLYAGLSAIALAGVRGDGAAGFWAVLFLFAVVWVTDIAAYFVGRRFGGPKLAPAISPGKTWSGAIGGAVFGLIAGTAVAAASGAASLATIAAALVLSVVSQAGDLFESWVKRRNGAKDSGRLIPGHGGVMDRVDGLVAAAMALYLIAALVSAGSLESAGLFPR